jgi:hypothetical protein
MRRGDFLIELTVKFFDDRLVHFGFGHDSEI